MGTKKMKAVYTTNAKPIFVGSIEITTLNVDIDFTLYVYKEINKNNYYITHRNLVLCWKKNIKDIEKFVLNFIDKLQRVAGTDRQKQKEFITNFCDRNWYNIYFV